MSRIDAAAVTLKASLAKRDAVTDTPGRYEWYGENGDHVIIVVDCEGQYHPTINGVPRARVDSGASYQVACVLIERLMNKETIR